MALAQERDFIVSGKQKQTNRFDRVAVQSVKCLSPSRLLREKEGKPQPGGAHGTFYPPDVSLQCNQSTGTGSAGPLPGQR